jgi:hypothetical protein
MVGRPRASTSAERYDVVAAHESNGALSLDDLDRRVASVFVGSELIAPNVAGAFDIDDFQAPGLVLF